MNRHLITLATLIVLGLFSTVSVQAADLIRIGILGIDNYGSVAYTEFLNKPHAEGVFEGMRVVAAYPIGSDDYPESKTLGDKWKDQLSKMYQTPKDPKDAVPPIDWVDSLDELLKRVDCVMIFSLDARLHRKQAESVLRAGKKLFIGRPLASSPEDAVAIMKLAAETKTPCWSGSQHRFSTGFAGMVNHPEVGKVIGCDVYGGWDPKTPEVDKFWLPLHSLETLYTIMGGPGVVSVTCASTPTTESITATWKDGRVGTYRGIKEGAVKYKRDGLRRQRSFDGWHLRPRHPGHGSRPDERRIRRLQTAGHRDRQVLQDRPSPGPARRNAGDLRADAGRRRK